MNVMLTWWICYVNLDIMIYVKCKPGEMFMELLITLTISYIADRITKHRIVPRLTTG